MASGSVADLRSALAALAPSSSVAAVTRTVREIRHEIRKIEQKLNTDEPDGAAVKSRWKSILWKSILTLRGDAVTAGEQIARITNQVVGLFGC